MKPRSPSEIPEAWMPLVREISSLVGRSDPAYRQAFAELANGSLFSDLTLPRLRRLCDGAEDRGSHRRQEGGPWLLFSDDHVALEISVISQPDGLYVDTPTSDMSLAVVGPYRLRVERYRTTFPLDQADVIHPDCLLEPLGISELTAGDVLHLSAHRDLIRFAHCEQPLPILRLGIHGSARSLCWHYDTSTGRPIGCSHARSESSQSELLIKLIVEQKRLDRIGFVTDSLMHPVHTVRWAAVKALWALDPEQALAATRRCRDDRHPQVRNAAAATLRMYEAKVAAQPPGAQPCL